MQLSVSNVTTLNAGFHNAECRICADCIRAGGGGKSYCRYHGVGFEPHRGYFKVLAERRRRACSSTPWPPSWLPGDLNTRILRTSPSLKPSESPRLGRDTDPSPNPTLTTSLQPLNRNLQHRATNHNPSIGISSTAQPITTPQWESPAEPRDGEETEGGVSAAAVMAMAEAAMARPATPRLRSEGWFGMENATCAAQSAASSGPVVSGWE
jgi:hypothetical protein